MNLKTGDRLWITDRYDDVDFPIDELTPGNLSGTTFRYTSSPATGVNLHTLDFTDPDHLPAGWVAVPNTAYSDVQQGDRVNITAEYDAKHNTHLAGKVFQYIGTSKDASNPGDDIDLLSENFATDTAHWVELKINGTPGATYRFIGTAAEGVGRDLNQQNYLDGNFWEVVQPVHDVPSALAYIRHATVNAGSVAVTATDDATISALVDTSVTASGGGFDGGGDVIAANPTVATNLILSGADAHILESAVVTTGDAATSPSRRRTPRTSMPRS